jgi:hypothetical protein
MAIYAVFEPPVRDEEDADYAERFAFVRDGFSMGRRFSSGRCGCCDICWIIELIAWLVLVGALAVLARLVPLPSDTTWLVLVPARDPRRVGSCHPAAVGLAAARLA